MEIRDELAQIIKNVVGPFIDPAWVTEEWTEAADEILKAFEVRTKKHAAIAHNHEAWMVRTLDDGTHYCAACGQEVPSPYPESGRMQVAEAPKKLRSRLHEFHDGDRVVWNERPYTVVDTTLRRGLEPWALLEPKDTDLRTSWVPEKEIKREEG